MTILKLIGQLAALTCCVIVVTECVRFLLRLRKP